MSASAQLTTTVDRVFVKRTRRGQVKTHVRQTYLRDDLPSGSPHIDGPELEPRLSASATRYLVLDTNVVLHQIDLLERPTLCDVIITQTVLDEVRHNKISVHKRLRALITDGMPEPRTRQTSRATTAHAPQRSRQACHSRGCASPWTEKRRFHVFSNEFHRDTFVQRQPGESPNDHPNPLL